MKEFSFVQYVVLVMTCLCMALAGLYLLGNFKTLLRRAVRNELLRQNMVAFLIIFCFIIATAPFNEYFFKTLREQGLLVTVVGELIAAAVNTIFVFNIVRSMVLGNWIKRLPFLKQRVVIFFTLVFTCVLFNVPLNCIANNFRPDTLKYSILTNTYMGALTGMVYFLMTIIEADRSRKMQEKELELSRLGELKTKAELDALHAKVNPHFLYNALNSIADLAITDGKKARKMTIALADLFRYSINYRDDNYTTLQEEVAMTEVYLEIEKIRFEDQLTCTVVVDPAVSQYLVPRFILQSLAENAVKHGLKATGRMTEITLEAKGAGAGLEINMIDNGPPFPQELNPGYGIKSVFDKLDLLFPGQYEIFFRNEPRKEVSIVIHKMVSHESAF